MKPIVARKENESYEPDRKVITLVRRRVELDRHRSPEWKHTLLHLLRQAEMWMAIDNVKIKAPKEKKQLELPMGELQQCVRLWAATDHGSESATAATTPRRKKKRS